MPDESVSHWILELKAGSQTAAERVWERYFKKLVELARRRLGTAPRTIADEEDVALSALDSFFRRAADGRFPQLEDRDDLWKLLFTITDRKATTQIKHQRRQKRGGGHRVERLGSDVIASPHSPVSPELPPDFALQLAEEMTRLLEMLQDETLVQVAVMKMEGYTNEELAATLGLSKRTIMRKQQVIRSIWSHEVGMLESDDGDVCQ